MEEAVCLNISRKSLKYIEDAQLQNFMALSLKFNFQTENENIVFCLLDWMFLGGKANRVRASRRDKTFHSEPWDSGIKIVYVDGNEMERNGVEWHTIGNIGKWQLTILMVCIVCVHASMWMTHATMKQCQTVIILIWQWHFGMRTNRRTTHTHTTV